MRVLYLEGVIRTPPPPPHIHQTLWWGVSTVLNTCVQAVACGVSFKTCHSLYPHFWLIPGQLLVSSSSSSSLLCWPVGGCGQESFSCIWWLHENRQYLRIVYLFCNRLS